MAYTQEFSTEHCILEPIGKTEIQTAYRVRENGLLLGLIFHIHATNTWQCCDGQSYACSTEAVAGLIKLSAKWATAENQNQETKSKSATVANIYTKAASARIIDFASVIEAVRELRNCIQVTYLIKGKRCSTFVSKKKFELDFYSFRQQGAQQIEVVEQCDENFIVKSGENYYTVRPNHSDPHQRCECGDCHYRGSKCKHQIAVEQFLTRQLQAA
jgi:hypothetical protein